MRAKSSSILPQHKIATSGLSGAIACIVFYVLERYAGIHLPADVAAAITTVITFLVGYWTEPKLHEIVPRI